MRAPGPRVARPLRPRPAAGRGTPVENRGTALRRDLCRPPEREPTGGAMSPAGLPGNGGVSPGTERPGAAGAAADRLPPSHVRFSSRTVTRSPESRRCSPHATTQVRATGRRLSPGRSQSPLRWPRLPCSRGLSPAQQREALRAPPHLRAPTTASARLRALVHRVVRWAFARVYEGPWGRGLLQTAHWSAPGARRTVLVASGLPFPPATRSPARGGRVAHT